MQENLINQVVNLYKHLYILFNFFFVEYYFEMNGTRGNASIQKKKKKLRGNYIKLKVFNINAFPLSV
jgi:hypothetical protein